MCYEVILWLLLSFCVAKETSPYECVKLAPQSLGIGQFCLSTCDGHCAQFVSPPGTMNYPLNDHPAIPSDCENTKGRLMCMSTDPNPHGYPLCDLIDTRYCKENTCACWSPCISHECPPKFVKKEHQRTNSGCFDSNLRVLCVS
ncbi:signal peptide containing protein [Theileria equi strain WA]|uniref:Signal peptide containing protein n=1 Tax=Theileria equi strain WA TaxID=1537102 RepID=L1LFV3_THEEQ|nr:signal peptide containing protein [Theileria equi strain WA]EKX74145.1 signal peptide containing protein [Theileria equi strain WA]|eukprot:XP_004833597.1 signal peptide containing protein [Theileria equi strain WA]